jgi:DNA-binding response OmpR family regulator
MLKELGARCEISHLSSLDDLQNYLTDQLFLSLPEAILVETDPEGQFLDFIERMRQNPKWGDIILVIIATEENQEWKTRALKLRAHDYYTQPFLIEHLIERLNFLVKFKLIKPQLPVYENADVTTKSPTEEKNA